jgi:hypothetical protein
MIGACTTLTPHAQLRVSPSRSSHSYTMSAITVPTGKRHPILAAYLAQLALHPVRTKALTTGSLVFLQEVLGAHLARVPVKRPSKHAPAYEHVAARARVDAKAVKMFLYGLLVSAPLGHVLVGALQRAFAGRTDSRAKLLQILASNLIVAPIQTIGASAVRVAGCVEESDTETSQRTSRRWPSSMVRAPQARSRTLLRTASSL